MLCFANRVFLCAGACVQSAVKNVSLYPGHTWLIITLLIITLLITILVDLWEGVLVYLSCVRILVFCFGVAAPDIFTGWNLRLSEYFFNAVVSAMSTLPRM